MAIVYKTTNLINGKIYVGKYCGTSDNYLGSGTYFLRAVKKYGKENFVRETIETIEENHDYLMEREIYWIAELDAMNPAVGYNLCEGGGGSVGRKASDETKQKMSDAQSGENNPRYGVIVSDETRKKISDAKSNGNNPWWGRKHTLETKKKMSENHADVSGENNPMFGRTGKDSPSFGKTHTLETKQKISESMSGKNNYRITKKEKVLEIISLLNKKYSMAEIREMLNVSEKVIGKIKNTTYFHDIYDLPKNIKEEV